MSFRSDLEAFAAGAMDRLAVPGAAIGIVSGSNREVSCLGVTALDTRFDVRPDTLFQVGSVSKPFTATLLVALADAGKVDLDAPVVLYVPDLELGSQEATREITVRQLLTHQSGFWGDWFDDFGLGDDAMERFVAEYSRLPQMFEPGSMWAYNNCGYILAGFVASRITGKPFETALQEIILDPLDLDHTFLSAADAIAFPVAVGHTNSPDDGSASIARQFLRPRARNPAGGVLSSIDDILTFAELHLGKHPDILPESVIASMQKPQAETYEAGASWGLGFKIDSCDGGTVVGHGGATNGFRAQLSLVPERDFAVAVLTNSDSGSQLATEIVDWILERRLDIKPVQHPTRSMPAGAMDQVRGTFAHPYASIEVDPIDSGLRGRVTTFSPYSENSEPQTGGWFGLRHIGDWRFEITGGEMKGAQAKFWVRDNGTVRYLQAGGRLYVPGSWDELEGSST